MNVSLIKMTRNTMHAFFKNFAYDPLALGEEQASVYVYDQEIVDQIYDKHQKQGKQHFAIMHEGQVIGDIYLKHINFVSQTCEMGIHIVNDKYKGKGYGTQAEMILLAYAFNKLNMKAVYANTLINNERSMHVLKKAGFIEVYRNAQTVHFECRKSSWKCTEDLPGIIIA